MKKLTEPLGLKGQCQKFWHTSNWSHRKRRDWKGHKALGEIIFRMFPSLLEDKIYKSKKFSKLLAEKYERKLC